MLVILYFAEHILNQAELISGSETKPPHFSLLTWGNSGVIGPQDSLQAVSAVSWYKSVHWSDVYDTMTERKQTAKKVTLSEDSYRLTRPLQHAKTVTQLQPFKTHKHLACLT